MRQWDGNLRSDTSEAALESRENSEIDGARYGIHRPPTHADAALLYDVYRQCPSSEAAQFILNQYDLLYVKEPSIEVALFALRIIHNRQEVPNTQRWFQRLEEESVELEDWDVCQIGLIYAAFGKNREAVPWLFRAHTLLPEEETIHLTLAQVLMRLSEPNKALRVLLTLPRDILFGNNALIRELIRVSVTLSRYELALAGQRIIVRNESQDLEDLLLLAKLLNYNGLCEEEMEVYQRCLKQYPSSLGAQLGLAFSIPPLYETEEELVQVRQRVKEESAKLKQWVEQSIVDSDTELSPVFAGHTNFSLAYQLEEDKPVLSQYGDILHNVVQTEYPVQVSSAPSSRQRPSVAIYSHLMWNHTVGKLFHQWLVQLSEQGMDVALISSSSPNDPITQRITKSIAHIEIVPHTIGDSIQAIQSLAPDVLIYPELGMDPVSFAVAATRLAPIQCMGWGHPVTSGLPTVDYFLSSELMEPPNGQTSYRESLVRLPGISINYVPPTLPSNPTSKEDLGLPQGRTLFLCCQALYKLLPRYDAVYAELLRRNPQADLVFIANRSHFITEKFTQRLSWELERQGVSPQRIHLVGPLNHHDYLSLNLHADVFLDSQGWSGGNTTLEALACGLPIVSTPGSLMRGRHSSAILEQAGFSHWVSPTTEAWIERATLYAQDSNLREDHGCELRACANKVYQDPKPIQGLREWLTSVYSASNSRSSFAQKNKE